jgi:hypothetical protein
LVEGVQWNVRMAQQVVVDDALPTTSQWLSVTRRGGHAPVHS